MKKISARLCLVTRQYLQILLQDGGHTWRIAFKKESQKGKEWITGPGERNLSDVHIKVQNIAKNFNEAEFEIKILLFPVTHPELNPAEIVWSKIKREISAKNLLLSLRAVEEMTKQALVKFTASEFTKYVKHVKLE